MSYRGRVRDGVVILEEGIRLADGLSRGPGRGAAVRPIRDLLRDPAVTVVEVSRTLFEWGLELYEKRPDKEWSLTDCIPFVVMEREQVDQSLTADHHFRQARFTALLA